MNFNTRVYWNSRAYGSAVRVRKSWILAGYSILAIAVPVIIPLPFVVVLNKLIKTDIVWRYD